MLPLSTATMVPGPVMANVIGVAELVTTPPEASATIALTYEMSFTSVVMDVWSAVTTSWLAVVPVAGLAVTGTPQVFCHDWPAAKTAPTASCSAPPDVPPPPMVGHMRGASPRYSTPVQMNNPVSPGLAVTVAQSLCALLPISVSTPDFVGALVMA